MMCPTEFTCAVFAEGELPETEAREVARHVRAIHLRRRQIRQPILDADDDALARCIDGVAEDRVSREIPGRQPCGASAERIERENVDAVACSTVRSGAISAQELHMRVHQRRAATVRDVVMP